ncbi:hypothetical protein J2046_005719 [Rhizobium petrolearium]|uniref:PepSY domain-containing protein n=1 Tax=Neorhizobium petrolearium TaxID=515361 RepID=UPI001AE516A4|nr:PepSY domain-containing protein [Neorhizobium petrolearium]MBP1847435.1 hypothetical protein [Neorhizobium petrolearium]
MKKLILATLVLTAAATGLARAEESHSCGNTPKDKWLSEDVIKEKAKAAGLEVRQVKVEKGCYEVYAKDSKGKRVEVLFNPSNGEAVGNESD